LLTDGYEPYEAVVAAQSLVHAGCMAYVRRRFEEARKVQTAAGADSRARTALDYIGELYRIERTIKTAEPKQRPAVRAAHSAPLMTRFRTWLEALAPEVLPQSVLGKAVHYALKQWPKLSVFLTHPVVPLDNNRCENAIRPFVLGRKAWLFSDTTGGATASANLYSLVETARANGIEPHAYLAQVFTRLPAASALEDFEALLPWNVKAELAASR
jgi:transposase